MFVNRGEHMAQGQFVAYYRVSTGKQGRSGLGLEAQRSAVANYLNGGRWHLFAETTEIESGADDDRPELAKALALCRKHKATLVIAKQDRLARRVAFVANLMESGVPFVVADHPNASPFELHIRAAVDEEERRRISERTRAALQAARQRGKRLGWSNPARTDQAHASKRGATSNRTNAERFAANIMPVVREIQATGIKTLQGIADALNRRGIPTARKTSWHPSTVRNLLARA